jgi:hypothetical protein
MFEGYLQEITRYYPLLIMVWARNKGMANDDSYTTGAFGGMGEQKTREGSWLERLFTSAPAKRRLLLVPHAGEGRTGLQRIRIGIILIGNCVRGWV